MELLTSLLKKYGLLGLCLMILLEYACFPISSELVLPFSGAVARAENVSFFLLLPLSVLAGLLGTGGKFCMVYPAFRMAQALCTLSAHRLEPKRLRLVQERRDSAPSVFLVECRRDGKPGLTVEPTLIIREPDGTETQEVRDIYHR